MKTLLLLLINLYQIFFSVILRNILGVQSFCRFSPTCSNYAKQAIKDYGVVKGLALSFIRISKCQPFSKLELHVGNLST